MTLGAMSVGTRGRQRDWRDAAIQTCLKMIVLFGIALMLLPIKPERLARRQFAPYTETDQTITQAAHRAVLRQLAQRGRGDGVMAQEHLDRPLSRCH